MRRGKLLRSRRGTTLVEMIVCAALLAMLLGAFAALVGPFSNMFLRLQSLNHAQSIADTVLDTLGGELLNAQEYIQFYTEGYTFVNFGRSAGAAVEYKNRDGYVVLISAEGCKDTTIVRNNKATGSIYAFPPGYLLMRYYRAATDAKNQSIYYYRLKEGEQMIARGVSQVYGENFYAGYTIKLTFDDLTFDESKKGEKKAVTSLKATVSVHRGERFVWEDSAILDLAFAPKLNEGTTATVQETPLTPAADPGAP